MAQTQYGTLITTIGLAQIANAQITQTKVGLEYIALGDGNGAHYVPTQNQTALVHEVWRGPIAELSIDPTNSNRIIVDAVIPFTAGGFTIREIGVFDDKNQLIAVGQYPEKYKPQLSEGVSEETIIHFVIETNNADVVKLTIDPTVIIASRNYVDGKVAQVQTALTEHSAQIATEEKFGHFKPDGKTIIVNPVTGVASTQEQGYQLTDKVGNSRLFNGDLNTLTAAGFYYSIGSEKSNNFPQSWNNAYTIFIEVITSETGFVIQRVNKVDNIESEIWIRGKYLGTWAIWEKTVTRLDDTLTSTSTSSGATANAVKKVNDKLTGLSVTIGEGTTTDSVGVAIGRNATANGSSTSLGAFSKATGSTATAIGYNANAINANEGVLGGNLSSATNVWRVPGSFSVTGTKNFEIPHPNPNKKYTHVIRHGAVESPTTGDTLYRYEVEATVDGETVEVQLPDYFEHLNTNVDVWVNPDAHFGRAYGKVVGDKLLVTCEKVGGYKALVIGTRNDDNVQDWYIKGVEREIGESWLGETHVFEVDEISEVTEFEEVL